jgi:hypothetical protein
VPALLMRNGDFWAQGLDLGPAFRYQAGSRSSPPETACWEFGKIFLAFGTVLL